ncbi:MAG: VanZ family protein [Pseudomonadota bacterium]
MKSLDLRLIARILAVFSAVGIGYLSLVPSGDSAAAYLFFLESIAQIVFGDASQVDKVGHFLAYAVLGGLSAFGVRMVGEPAMVLAILALALGVYGGVLEMLQGFFPERVSSLADWFANMLGVAAGFAFAETIHMTLRRHQP